MQLHLCSTVAVVAILICFLNVVDVNGKQKGSENWKQRFQSWKESDERNAGGMIIGTDEAIAAKHHREDFNSIWDSPTEKEDYQKGIAAVKELRQNIREKPKGLEIGELEQQNIAVRHVDVGEPQFGRRRQPREYRLEQYVRDQQDPNPPPHEKVAEMARYIVHNSDWGALAYTSRQPGSDGKAMADILSISDGSGGNSTGVPYMYVTPRDMGIQDLAKDSHCSLAMTLAQGDYCRKESLDPEDPRCAHVFLNGKLKTLKNGSAEWTLAKKYFFDRHPHLENMPKDHKFRLVKLKISQVIVQDYFGGPAFPTLSEYFAAKPSKPIKEEAPAQEQAAELLPGVKSSDLDNAPIP